MRLTRLYDAAKAADAGPYPGDGEPTVEDDDAYLAAMPGIEGKGTASLTAEEKAALLDSPLYGGLR